MPFPGQRFTVKFVMIFMTARLPWPAIRPRSTWFGHYPVGRIDYIFVNANFNVCSIIVPRTDLEKIASDHLPLITELDFINS